MSMLLCQHEDRMDVCKPCKGLPEEVREEDAKQESQPQGKIAPANGSRCKHDCGKQGDNEQHRDGMHLVKDSQEEQGREKPALPSLEDTQKECEDEEDDKWRHQIRLPEKARILERESSSSIEQGSNDTRKPPIIPTREDICEQSRCSGSYSHYYRPPKGISAQRSYQHQEINDPWWVSDADRGSIARCGEQTMMESVVSQTVEPSLIVIQLSGSNLIEAQEASYQQKKGDFPGRSNE